MLSMHVSHEFTRFHRWSLWLYVLYGTFFAVLRVYSVDVVALRKYGAIHDTPRWGAPSFEEEREGATSGTVDAVTDASSHAHARRSGECSLVLAGTTWFVYQLVTAARRSDQVTFIVRRYVRFKIIVWSFLVLQGGMNIVMSLARADTAALVVALARTLLCATSLRLAWLAQRIEARDFRVTPV